MSGENSAVGKILLMEDIGAEKEESLSTVCTKYPASLNISRYKYNRHVASHTAVRSL